jgi:LuxR family maltose regulon positive regulatory protein
VGTGDVDGGIEAYQHGMEIAYTAENYLSAFAAVFFSTVYLIRQGRLNEAYAYCNHHFEKATQDGLSQFPAFGLLFVAMALIALERDQLDDARDLVDQGGGFSEALRYGRTIRARLHLALGEPNTAISFMEDVERIVVATGEPQAIAEMYVEWARLYIQLGDVDQVRTQYLRLRQLDSMQLTKPLLRMSCDWLSAYIDWVDGEHDTALDTLQQATRRARQSRSDGDLLRLLILKALVLDTAGRSTESQVALEEALTIGFSQDYRRIWLDAGKEIGPLLRKANRSGELSPAVQPYGDAILSLCEEAYESTAHLDKLATILTDREIDILRLVCQGYSNAEIAEQCVITLNTVKKHTSNIYSKLNVTSRTQAVARARELDLIL